MCSGCFGINRAHSGTMQRLVQLLSYYFLLLCVLSQKSI
jgi:hypothetical protein